MMLFDFELIKSVIPEAMAIPATGDPFLDSIYAWYAKLVGHDNPYYKLFWLLAKRIMGPSNIVELGSYRGTAAAHFASGSPSARVATVDIHREDKDAMTACRHAAIHYPNLEYINAWTWDAAPYISQHYKPIDILYIDAWHEYQYAIKEWALYEPLLADEALVIADDIFDMGGATVDMVKFWNEISAGRESFVNTGLHDWVPMGFMRYTR